MPATFTAYAKNEAGWWGALNGTRHHDRAQSRRFAERQITVADRLKTVLEAATAVPTCPCRECEATRLMLCEAGQVLPVRARGPDRSVLHRGKRFRLTP